MSTTRSKAAGSNVVRFGRLDRRAVEDGQLLEHYLADQLDDERRAAFEAYCLEHPDVFDDADAVTRLQDGLRRLRGSGELDRLICARQPAYRRPAIIAAMLMTVLVAAFWITARQEPPFLSASATELAAPPGRRLQLMVTRTSSYDATLRLTGLPQVIELRVLPAMAQPVEHQASLVVLRGAGSEASVGGLYADDVGFLTLYLHTVHLQPGLYQLKLTTAGGAAGDYLIEVRAD